MKNILIIQTAFIGDVILATGLIESLSAKYPDAKIDFLLRKGNESLLHDHPKLNHILIWDKKNNKFTNLKKLVKQVRKNKYDLLLNLQRFGSSGFLSWRSGAAKRVGFRKNPFSFSYEHKVDHVIDPEIHEIDRNFKLLEVFGDFEKKLPKLYPSEAAFEKVRSIKGENSLVVLAPASVWFTKQLPKNKWLDIIQLYDKSVKIILIGGPSDRNYLEEIKSESAHKNLVNMAGELNLLESAALIGKADMTHVNDSAPLHLATAMNAPVTAYFCSTIPGFGFGPLSDNSKIVETTLDLKCRPCGLHGKRACPEGHFKCAKSIQVTNS